MVIKKVIGRKRLLVVVSTGHLISCIVGPTNEHDLTPAKRLIEKIKKLDLPKVVRIVADGAYTGLMEWLGPKNQFLVQISLQLKTSGFVPIPLRWKVERFISWQSWSRRLSRDFESELDSSEAWILIFGIKNILKYF